jgi:hypothetical protein
MDLTIIIQVAIGIVFVWVILAVITSQIQDWISQALSWKANMLEDSIKGMLAGDEELKGKFYEHPLIKSLHTEYNLKNPFSKNKDAKRKPAGIPEDKFALVLFDVFMNAGSEASLFEDAEPTFDKLHKSISGLKKSGNTKKAEIARSLDTLLMGMEDKLRLSDAGIAASRIRVEGWFNNSIDRLRGAYIRRLQMVAILVGVLLAAILNADSFAIINKLWNDPVARQVINDQAQKFELPANASSKEIEKYVNDLQVLPIPIGWIPENMPKSGNELTTKIIGILISGIAAAQGAPFWFDIMRKIINFRSGGGSSEPAKG